MVVAMGRPEIREVQSVENLALISVIYSYTLETYAFNPSFALAQLDGNYKANSSLGPESRDLQTSRANFEGGLKEGTDDKGFVTRYIVMFLILLDEAVMEDLAESREKMSVYDTRNAEYRTASWTQDAHLLTQSSDVSVFED